MFSNATGKKGIVFVALLSVVTFAVILAVTVPSHSKEADAENDKLFETNEAGQTYGSMSDNVYDPASNPDLVRVVATNGEIGYVYYSEFYEHIKDEPTRTSEEVEAHSEAQREKYNDAFIEIASDRYGYTFENIDEAIEAAQEGPDAVAEAYSRPLEGGAPHSEEYEAINEEAHRRIGVALTVYMDDGVTPIGEFILGI